jgi:hypothetical protein
MKAVTAASGAKMSFYFSKNRESMYQEVCVACRIISNNNSKEHTSFKLTK